MSKSDVTLDDFMTGLIAGLAELGVSVVSIRGNAFYTAVVEAFQVFEGQARTAHLRPRFWLSLNKVYGDSPDVRDALTRAVQRDLVSLDNPEYQDMRLKITSADAELYLESLPGESELYVDAAKKFQAAYPAFA
jgi:hypothetical protein